MINNGIFNQYLSKGIIPSIGNNDENYKNIMEAVKKIAESLAKHPAKIPIYTLIAFDDQVQETDSILMDVEQAISSKWKTLRSHFAQSPVILYRAVILSALEMLSKDDKSNNKFHHVIFLSISDLYPYLSIPQKEEPILTDFLNELGANCEKDNMGKWSISKKPNLKDVKFVIPHSKPLIQSSTLKSNILTTAESAGIYGSAALNMSWVNTLYEKMASGLTKTLNEAFAKSSINSGLNP